MKRLTAALLLLTSAALSGCDGGPKSAKGFSLPEGDVARGRKTFVDLECNACHTVSDIEPYDHKGEPPISVALGGEVARIKTYGDLVTSIINPSHRFAPGYPAASVRTEDGQSKMVNYNSVMKVSELIDLVAFLQSEYTLIPYEPTDYTTYRIF